MVDATRLGAWLRSGEGIGWLAAGTMPNSLYRVPFLYLFLACVFCHLCSFLFVVFVCVFLLLSVSFVDFPPIFFCPADDVPDWQPRILLGMVEAGSVTVKKTTTTTTTTTLVCRCHDVFLWCYVCFVLLRVRLYDFFIEAAALCSIVLRYAGAPIDSHT